RWWIFLCQCSNSFLFLNFTSLLTAQTLLSQQELLSLRLPQLQYAVNHMGNSTTNSIRAIAPTEVHHWSEFISNMLIHFNDTPRFAPPPLLATAANIEVSTERELQAQVQSIIFPLLNTLNDAEKYGDPVSYDNRPAE